MQGVSTRSVDELVKAMGMSGISKSQVSRLCAEIDERVGAFLSRPIEGDWPYLWIDATYVKVPRGRPDRLGGRNNRRGGQHRRRARGAGHGDRPLGGGAVLDGLPALADAARPARREAGDLRRARGAEGRGRQGARRTWQRCRVHFMRNAWPTPARASGRWCWRRSTPCSRRRRAEAASRQWRVVADQLRGKFPKLADDDGRRRGRRAGLHDLPEGAPHADPSTNPLERLNAEIKRRTDVVGIFPNEAVDHAAGRRVAARAERRVATAATIHAA